MVTFFTGTIFYEKALKFTKQLYTCFYAFKVLCFYSWQSYLETIITGCPRQHPTELPFIIIAMFSMFFNCIFFTGKYELWIKIKGHEALYSLITISK